MPSGHRWRASGRASWRCSNCSQRVGLSPHASKWVVSIGSASGPATWRRQKSCTASASRALSSASSSCTSGICAASGVSASARWQKPWMVKMAASSKPSSAARRRAIRSASSAPWARRLASNWGTKGSAPVAAGASSPASVSTRRWRSRSRSSAVAALVKVTTRICCTVQRRSSSRRRYRPQIAQVLPVPADASISRTPPSGTPKTSSACGVVMPRPRRRDGRTAVPAPWR